MFFINILHYIILLLHDEHFKISAEISLLSCIHISQFYSHDIIEFIFILCTSCIVWILHQSHFNPFFFNEIVVSRCETVCVNGVLPHVTDTNKLHKNAPVWNFTLIWEGSYMCHVNLYQPDQKAQMQMCNQGAYLPASTKLWRQIVMVQRGVYYSLM